MDPDVLTEGIRLGQASQQASQQANLPLLLRLPYKGAAFISGSSTFATSACSDVP
ncbi:hypothetical protein TMEN_2963 [Trichophyton mentagrophytes]|nr:hypothetical protein TMEN_2963 [Trichophyton mentagrophytes]